MMRPLLRPLSRLGLAALALTVFSAPACVCDDDGDPIMGPALERGRFYTIAPTTCGDCRSMTLYRFVGDSEIELRAHEANGDYVGRNLGLLTPATQEQLDALVEALAEGEQSIGELPQAVPADGSVIYLSLPSLTLSYAENYPPAGVEELDTLLGAILDDLSQCQASERVAPDIDCEALDWWPSE